MKRHPALTDLARDHFHALRCAQLIRKAQTSAELQAAADALLALWKDDLVLHFREEEEVLLPILSRRGPLSGQPDAVRMLNDHAYLRDGLRRLESSSLKAPAYASLLKDLGARLEQHARFEDREMFGRLESMLSPEELEEIATMSRRLRAAWQRPVGPIKACNGPAQPAASAERTIPLDPRVQGLSPSATLAINETSARLVHEGRQVFRLGLGQSPFPVPESLTEELRRHAHQKDYLPVAGLPALRQAVSAYHNQRDGVSSTERDVVVGPGSKELLFLAQLCFQGTLLLPSPAWVSYAPQAAVLGRPVRWLPTTLEDGWRLDPEILREALSQVGGPAMLILNYPNNPTGTTLGRGRLARLAEVCREFGTLVISDEIYGEVHHHGQHVSLASFYEEGTVISSGLSKWCGAGGWRLGTFTFPAQLGWLREAMIAVASETYTSVCAPVQHAAVEAFLGGPEIHDYLDLSRRVLRAVGETAWNVMRDAGLSVARPEGGFYLFPDASPLAEKLTLRGISDSPTLCQKILDETGVASLPGVHFGRQAQELTFRLATVSFDGARALHAAAKAGGEVDRSFVEDHCGPLMTALNRLAQWFT